MQGLLVLRGTSCQLERVRDVCGRAEAAWSCRCLVGLVSPAGPGLVQRYRSMAVSSGVSGSSANLRELTMSDFYLSLLAILDGETAEFLIFANLL